MVSYPIQAKIGQTDSMGKIDKDSNTLLIMLETFTMRYRAFVTGITRIKVVHTFFIFYLIPSIIIFNQS